MSTSLFIFLVAAFFASPGSFATSLPSGCALDTLKVILGKITALQAETEALRIRTSAVETELEETRKKLLQFLPEITTARAPLVLTATTPEALSDELVSNLFPSERQFSHSSVDLSPEAAFAINEMRDMLNLSVTRLLSISIELAYMRYVKMNEEEKETYAAGARRHPRGTKPSLSYSIPFSTNQKLISLAAAVGKQSRARVMGVAMIEFRNLILDHMGLDGAKEPS